MSLERGDICPRCGTYDVVIVEYMVKYVRMRCRKCGFSWIVKRWDILWGV